MAKQRVFQLVLCSAFLAAKVCNLRGRDKQKHCLCFDAGSFHVSNHTISTLYVQKRIWNIIWYYIYVYVYSAILETHTVLILCGKIHTLDKHDRTMYEFFHLYILFFNHWQFWSGLYHKLLWLGRYTQALDRGHTPAAYASLACRNWDVHCNVLKWILYSPEVQQFAPKQIYGWKLEDVGNYSPLLGVCNLLRP